MTLDSAPVSFLKRSPTTSKGLEKGNQGRQFLSLRDRIFLVSLQIGPLGIQHIQIGPQPAVIVMADQFIGLMERPVLSGGSGRQHDLQQWQPWTI